MPALHTHEIVLRGRLSGRLLGPFLDDFTDDHHEAGVTRLVGTVRDASHLHGLVAYLASINAELISITPVTDPSQIHTSHTPITTTTNFKEQPMITVSHLTKSYGRRTVVDDLSFELTAGHITGFVGPNGAGKSTTMRMMVGLARPDGGTATYRGLNYAELRDPARTVGVVLDARAMHPGRSARNHLRAMAAISCLPQARVDEVLHLVGLDAAANQRVGGFSLGMRQRLAIAGALLGNPEVLMLDEPANGLDPDGIRWLRTMLTNFASDGGTVFVSSHFITELATFAHDLVVVGNGRLITAEPLADTLDRDRSLSLEDILLDLTRDAARYAAA